MTLRPDWNQLGLLEYVCEESNRCMGGNCQQAEVQQVSCLAPIPERFDAVDDLRSPRPPARIPRARMLGFTGARGRASVICRRLVGVAGAAGPPLSGES